MMCPKCAAYNTHTNTLVSDIAMFVLKRDVNLQLTNTQTHTELNDKANYFLRDSGIIQ